MNRYGTFLRMIHKHNLDLVCACGHASNVSVADLIECMPPQPRIADVLPRMRCARCGLTKEGELYANFNRQKTCGE